MTVIQAITPLVMIQPRYSIAPAGTVPLRDPFRQLPGTPARTNTPRPKFPAALLHSSPFSASRESILRAVSNEEGSLTDDAFDLVNVSEEGALWIGIVKRWNQGGVIVKAGSKVGFCPYSLLDMTRVEKLPSDRTLPDYGESLLRQPIRCLVIRIKDTKQPVLSEKEYLTVKALDYYKVGDVLKGKVRGIEHYGVFVDIPSEDGVYRGVRGFIHVSELSWDFVTRPETIVQIGDEVEVFVKEIKRYSNQISLSMRHERLDPLKESISKLLPLEGEAYENMSWVKPESLLPDVGILVEKLRLEPGIEEVDPARQAEVQHKVSLDLEIWISKQEVVDGFNLVAWSGRTLQEIHVKTRLSRDEMKDVLRSVIVSGI